MTNLTKASLALLAISVAGCSTPKARGANSPGRVIEFKSGPEGFDTRTFFYEGDKEVIAFDAQFTPQLATQSIEHLRKFTNKPISWLVITHPNPDKFNGASVFQAEGAKVIASKSTTAAIPGVHAYKEYFFVESAKMFKKGTYPQPSKVDQEFEGQMDLVLKGGERITLKELASPGVSSTQTVAYVANANALFVGDLIHYRAHAWLEGGIVNGKATPTIPGWIKDLREIARTYPGDTQVYGGRGMTTDLATAVPEQITYLEKARSLVRKQTKVMGDAPNFAELAKVFAQNFSGYEFPYMIEYGAYGLYQAEAAQ